jgi:hypothetical protein
LTGRQHGSPRVIQATPVRFGIRHRESYAPRMSRLHIYIAVFATLAVGCLGWVGWEQHRQAEESVHQTCIAHAIAANNIAVASEYGQIANGSAHGLAASNANASVLTGLVGVQQRNLRAC